MREKRNILIMLVIFCEMTATVGLLSASAAEDCLESGIHTAGKVKYETDYTECLGGYEADYYECIFCKSAVDAEGHEVPWQDGTGVHTAGETKYTADYSECMGGYTADFYLCEACGCPTDADGNEVLWQDETGKHTAGTVKYAADYTECSGGFIEDYYLCDVCGYPVDADGESLEYVYGAGKHIAGTVKYDANYTECMGGYEEDYYECEVCGYLTDAEGNEVEYKEGSGEHSIKENARKEPTYEEVGYEAHWYCESCGELFRDEAGTIVIENLSEITLSKLQGETEDVILPAVGGLTATTDGMNSVEVSWNAVNGATGYFILRGGIQIGFTMGSTYYLDRTADSENFNYYWVIPFYKNTAGRNVKGELGSYVWAIGRTLGQTKNLAATAGKKGIVLTWNKTANANGYVILSKTGSSKASFNTPVKATGTSYVDTEADGLTFYWVYATYANEAGVVAAGKVSTYAWAVAQ